MEYLFAPMEGVTYSVYRRVHHAFFPGADAYYTPFIAPDSAGSFKQKFLKELTKDRSDSLRIVPQLLSNNADSFVITLGKLKELDFEEVNLNAGCPSGTVFSKHKGSGMLTDLTGLDRFLDTAYNGAERLGIAVSIKTRMGVHSTEEFPAILDIYKKYPVSRLIIHARDRDGLYRSEPDLDGFREAFYRCRPGNTENVPAGNVPEGNIPAGNITAGNVPVGNVTTGNVQTENIRTGNVPAGNIAAGNITVGHVPAGNIRTGHFPLVTYNGNIFSAEELDAVRALVPELSSVMAGRGVIANPALIRVLRGGAALCAEELAEFHGAVIEAYIAEGLCERFTLERMKQLWYYMIHMFTDCAKEQKAILKSGSLTELRSAAAKLFRSGKFNEKEKFFQ